MHLQADKARAAFQARQPVFPSTALFVAARGLPGKRSLESAPTPSRRSLPGWDSWASRVNAPGRAARPQLAQRQRWRFWVYSRPMSLDLLPRGILSWRGRKATPALFFEGLWPGFGPMLRITNPTGDAITGIGEVGLPVGRPRASRIQRHPVPVEMERLPLPRPKLAVRRWHAACRPCPRTGWAGPGFRPAFAR